MRLDDHTSKIGVSLRTLARIFFTVSPSPEMHTLVTRARLCDDETDLASEVLTDAATLPPLASVISRHSLVKASALLV